MGGGVEICSAPSLSLRARESGFRVGGLEPVGFKRRKSVSARSFLRPRSSGGGAREPAGWCNLQRALHRSKKRLEQ